MGTLTIIILSLLGAIAGFAVGYYVVNNVVLKKKKEQALKDAALEGENIKKEKIFQAKEKFLQLKTEHEQFINEKNNQIHGCNGYVLSTCSYHGSWMCKAGAPRNSRYIQAGSVQHNHNNYAQ